MPLTRETLELSSMLGKQYLRTVRPADMRAMIADQPSLAARRWPSTTLAVVARSSRWRLEWEVALLTRLAVRPDTRPHSSPPRVEVTREPSTER